MKYRAIVVNTECFPYMEGCNILYTYSIQVKKWYGWITIKTMEGKYDIVQPAVDKLLESLRQNNYC